MQRSEMERMWAVERYRNGEDAEGICRSLGRSARWLYKWVSRADSDPERWFEERSRRPERLSRKTPQAIEDLIVAAREDLEREGAFCGAQSIVWELEERKIKSPSVATVNRILKARGLFQGRSARYQSKGKKYPAPEAIHPNDVHQNDFVGPRYLQGGFRFYSLNTADLVTARSTAIPIQARAADFVVAAIWKSWVSLGVPRIFQIDNELVFWGSRLHPRGMSQVLRLCLHQGVEPLFIPPAEPWRNGTIEKFNDHWQQKFLGRTHLQSFEHLVAAARDFDCKHNSRWRYSKTGGVSPNEALRRMNVQLRFPTDTQPPRLPILKPNSGRFHLIRFIRSDRGLDLFGERFVVPKIAVYEYVTATIDVALQQLHVRLGHETLARYPYQLR
jgi:putative transposase